jgi:hypothetical protein
VADLGWCNRDKVETTDMRQPWLWYPVARALSRKLIYHAGPTNSGKTHNALEAFKRARSGIYCGPLRLLAMEVYDRMNSEGTYCNLITGAGFCGWRFLQPCQRCGGFCAWGRGERERERKLEFTGGWWVDDCSLVD